MGNGRLGAKGIFDLAWEGLGGEFGLGSTLRVQGLLKTRDFGLGEAISVSAKVRAQQLQGKGGMFWLGTSDTEHVVVGHPTLNYATPQSWDTSTTPHQIHLHLTIGDLALEELERIRNGGPFQLLIDTQILLTGPGVSAGTDPGYFMAGVQDRYDITELEWGTVLQQWRRGVGIPIVVSIPQPLVGDRTGEIARLLSEAWKHINSGDFRGSIAEARKALELLRLIDPSANLPKKAVDRTIDHRVNQALDALFELASSPAHADGATATFVPERSDAVAVAGAAAAMANAVFRRIEREPRIQELLIDEELYAPLLEEIGDTIKKDDLVEIVSVLSDLLTQKGVKQWFHAGSQLLDGQSPVEVLKTGRVDDTLAAARSFIDGSYV
jgi:hypothetical protein